MGKLSEFRKAVKNPPMERLSMLNSLAYQMNIFGIIVVSIILVLKGVGYIMFAFVFAIIINWVAYKRERKQYERIIDAQKRAGIYKEAETDPSFTRKRFRVIQREFGSWIRYIIIAVIAVPLSLIRDIGAQPFWGKLGTVGLITLIFLIVYLFPVYWAAKYKSLKKEIKKDESI